jgi:membrane associated rhomboid family serine protease
LGRVRRFHSGSPIRPCPIARRAAGLDHAPQFRPSSRRLAAPWRVIGGSGLLLAYIAGAVVAALSQFMVDPGSPIPMVGASGAISALFGLYALFFGRPKQVTRNQKLNRWIHVAWLLVAWVVLQWMAGYLAGGQGVMLATPAHIGGFIAGLVLQRPLLLWRYRKA